jgi:hypothetical protein
MSNDMRDGIQKLLNKTRWEPFSYITDSNLVLRRPGGQFFGAALIASAIIHHMIYQVKKDEAVMKRIAKDDKSE